jgi:hypothetical protein
MALSLNGVTFSGKTSMGQPPVGAPAWTQVGSYWSIAGDVATSSSPAWISSGDTLHGALLPAGTYTDVYISSGDPAFLGMTDGYGGINYFTVGVNWAAWYWDGTMRQAVNVTTGSAPSGLTGPQRYRLASKTGGVLTMSKVSLDGLTLQGTSASVNINAGYNPSTLHVVLFGIYVPGYGYAVPSATAYPIQAGTGGL